MERQSCLEIQSTFVELQITQEVRWKISVTLLFQFELDPSGWLFENSIHIGLMESYFISIFNCSKRHQRKESLRLTL